MNPLRIFIVLVLGCVVATAAPLPRLKVSDNKRFLVTADGQPFFWLGYTTWELFHRLNREEAIQIFEEQSHHTHIGLDYLPATSLASSPTILRSSESG